MASHQELTQGTAGVYSIQVSFIDKKTGTEYAADGKAINTTDPYLHDDRTADDVPMVDRSEGSLAPPAPLGPQYGVQNQVPWITSQQPSQYIFTQQPGINTRTVVQQEGANNYLPLSIFVCLCCCWPLGLWAILKSLQSRTLAEEGKYKEAKKRSQEAKTTIIVGIIMGIIVAVVLSLSLGLWYAAEIDDAKYGHELGR